MLTRCAAKSSHLKLNPFAIPKIRHAHEYKTKTFVPRADGPNYLIVQHLLQEFEVESQGEDFSPYKAVAFNRAIKAIDAFPEAIKSGLHAQKIPSIGNGIARRIEGYLSPVGLGPSNAPLTRTAALEEAARDRALLEFTRVPGIGLVKARKLYSAGCRTLEDLRKAEYQSLLPSSSKAALDFVEHLELRATRAQIDSTISDELNAEKDTIKSIVSSELRLHIVGSYRRGLSTSAEIDIIAFHPSYVYVPRPGEKPSEAIESLRSGKRGRPSKRNGASGKRKVETVSLLRETILSPAEHSGVIVATLSEGPRLWQGIVRIPEEGEDALTRAMRVRDRAGAFRRMNISLYPNLSEGAALLASTGDAEFNTHLRSVASKMGLTLDGFGIWRRWRSRNGASDSSKPGEAGDREKADDREDDRWELVASKTEGDIFEELGMEYVEPERRNFSFIASKQKGSKKK